MIEDKFESVKMECGMNHRIHAFVSSTALLQQGGMLFTAPRTWHPHIYEPLRKHSRHFISDILGLNEQSDKDSRQDISKDSTKDLIRNYSCKCEGCYLRTNTCQSKLDIKGIVTFLLSIYLYIDLNNNLF